jgi:hypothetical protein
MGGLNSKKEINQVLICGLDGAGKKVLISQFNL